MPRRKQDSESENQSNAKRQKGEDCEDVVEEEAEWTTEEKEILLVELERKGWKNLEWSGLQQRLKTKTEDQIKKLSAQLKVQRQVIESTTMDAKETSPLQVWTEFANQVTDPADTIAAQCIPQNHNNGSAVEVLTSLGQVNSGQDSTMVTVPQNNPTHVQAISTLPNDSLMSTANTDQVVIYVQSEDIHRTQVQQQLQQEPASSGRREGVVELSEALNNMLENQIKILRMLEDQNRRIESLTAEVNELKTLSPITTSLVQLLQLVQQQTQKIDQLQKSGNNMASGANTIVIQTPGNSTVIQAPSSNPGNAQASVKDLSQESKVASSSGPVQPVNMRNASNISSPGITGNVKSPGSNRGRPSFRLSPVVKSIEDCKDKDRLVAVGGNPTVQLPFWLYEDTIVRSRKPTLLAIHLSEAVFGTNTLLNSTPTGRYGMSSLDPVKLMAIKAEVISRFMESSTKQEKEDMWKNCITSIAKKCQALRSAHGLSSLNTPPRATSTENVLQQNVGDENEVEPINVAESPEKDMRDMDSMDVETPRSHTIVMDTGESAEMSGGGSSDNGTSTATTQVEPLNVRSDKIGGHQHTGNDCAECRDVYSRLKSKNKATLASISLARHFFGEEVLKRSTPKGNCGLEKLDREIMDLIKRDITRLFPKDTPQAEEVQWRQCSASIAKKCQGLRKGIPDQECKEQNLSVLFDQPDDVGLIESETETSVLTSVQVFSQELT